MVEYTDTIPVLRGHLEEMLQALQAAYGKSYAEDMARRYSQMDSSQHRAARLTGVLESQVGRVEGYLTPKEEEE
jgi:hypothetical protein